MLALLARFIGCLVGTAVTRIADVMFDLPGIVILLVIVTVFPRNITAAMSVFGSLVTPGLVPFPGGSDAKAITLAANLRGCLREASSRT